MATEYGYRYGDKDYWGSAASLEQLEAICKANDLTLIARDISPTRIVSIRA